MRNVLFMFLLLLLSCGKDDDGYRVYTVRAGNNSCNITDVAPKIGYNQESLQFSFKTSSDWLRLDNGVWNKVFGLALGDHRESSCRVGVKAVLCFLDFSMFVHKDGEFDWVIIGRYPADGRYYVDMGLVGTEWWMWFDGDCYKMPASQKKGIMPNYVCRPFVGGDKTKVIGYDWDVWIKF